MKILRSMSLVAFGIIFALFVPDKEKEDFKKQNIRLILENNSLRESNNKNHWFGGMTILPKDTKSIKLKGFLGTIAWYYSPNFDDLYNYDPAHFQMMGEPIQIEDEETELNIPAGVNAIFKKNISGHRYLEEINFGEAF